MQTSMKTVMRTLYRAYLRTAHRRFFELKARTHGMLSPLVYRKLYLLARSLPDLDVVEIGGASGAGSIALALGMAESGKRSRLIVVEKLQGGSRARYGGYPENLNAITSNFREFGVEDRIVLFPHELTLQNGRDVLALITTPELAAFVHDADGRLDRDFRLFWPRLRPGGLIIVDDYADSAQFTSISEEHPQGGIKSKMTYRLLNQMIAWGLFTPCGIVGDTIFGQKPEDAEFARFDGKTCTRIIEEVKRERSEVLGSAPEHRAPAAS